ncbi:hypothetical protein CAFE_16760 [Caprobacter fermentans]|uniref:Uncharacterized protein n=1 Tax=Caproicibacter fermentans TaxID=2576756 RepID=A0A6N8HYP6_9FIRM|nr:hypothetical protein [Caproicibacter fermentans]MVB10974.1 hypothetical protein [Caproicibacter fermentans]OCN01675.1 hypothetical protein A7X67_00855 [Clostridium sp. W14A]
MNLKEIGKSLLCGVLFVSAFYWTLVLTFLTRDFFFSIMFGSALLTNAALGLLLAADSRRHVFYKWLVSLPAAIAVFFCYRQSNFLYDWMNRIHPGYGNLSAGGGFAAAVCLLIDCLCFSVAVAVALALTRRNVKKGRDRRDGAI